MTAVPVIPAKSIVGINWKGRIRLRITAFGVKLTITFSRVVRPSGIKRSIKLRAPLGLDAVAEHKEQPDIGLYYFHPSWAGEPR